MANTLQPLVRISSALALARTVSGCGDVVREVAQTLDRTWREIERNWPKGPPSGLLEQAKADILREVCANRNVDPRTALLAQLLDGMTGESERPAIRNAFAEIEKASIDADAATTVRSIAATAGDGYATGWLNIEEDLAKLSMPVNLQTIRWRAFNIGENLDRNLFRALAVSGGKRSSLTVSVRAAERALAVFESFARKSRQGKPEPLRDAVSLARSQIDTVGRRLSDQEMRKLRKQVLEQLPDTERSTDRSLDPPSYAVLAIDATLAELAGEEPNMPPPIDVRAIAYELAANDVGLAREHADDALTIVHPAVCNEVAAEESDLATL